MGADLSGLIPGAFYQGQRNRFERVDFGRAHLAGTWGVTDVVDCDFSSASLDGVNFFQAGLVRCKFSGTLRNVIFDGRVLKPEQKAEPNPMEDIDMTEVVAFESVDFRGVHFDRIRLPDNPDLVVVKSGDWIDAALAAIGGRDDAVTVQAWLENDNKYTRPNGGDCFFNLGRMRQGRGLLQQLLAEYAPAANPHIK